MPGRASGALPYQGGAARQGGGGTPSSQGVSPSCVRRGAFFAPVRAASICTCAGRVAETLWRPPPAVACVLLPPAAMRAAPARPLRHLGGLQPPACRPVPRRTRAAIASCGAPTPALVGCGHLRVAPPRSRAAIASCPPRRLGALRPLACRSLLPCGPHPTEPPAASARSGRPYPRLGRLRPPACRSLPPHAGRDRLLQRPLLVALAGAPPPYGRLVLKGAPLRPPCATGQLNVSRETCAHG